MGSGDAGYGALTVHNISPASKSITGPSTKNALASGQSSTNVHASTNANTSPNPQRPANAVIITLSVLLSIAMVAVLTWYLRLRRQEQLQLRLGSDRSSSRHTHTRNGSGTRYVKPLKTSFHPSFKSSFGFGPSPDSPWSRTEGTITPLTRAAGQEFLYSPVVENGTLSSPEAPMSTRQPRQPLGGILSPPPVTSTNRTFRTSIHSLMVNRDVSGSFRLFNNADIHSMTTHNPSLAEDFFPHSTRPRTRLPSYHTDYAKSSPYSTDLKKGFMPGPITPPSDTSSPSEYTSLGLYTDIPPLPSLTKGKSARSPAPPSPFKTKPLNVSRPPKAPLAPIKTRQSLKEYLANDSDKDGRQTPSSTASLRAQDNSSARPSISSSYKLSEDLRGLLFLAQSVVVDDRPKVSRPADPDLSPTQGWTKLPDTGSSRRLA